MLLTNMSLLAPLFPQGKLGEPTNVIMALFAACRTIISKIEKLSIGKKNKPKNPEI